MGSVIVLPVSFVLGLLPINPSGFFHWCKWFFSYIYIEVYRHLTAKRFDIYDEYADGDAEKANFITPKAEFVLESPFPESHLLEADDEIFFYGVNSKSECLVVSIFRRCNQNADACIYLKLASGKQYQLEKTSGFQQSSCDKNVFSCGGLQINYMNPMRKWRIFYSGYLRETEGNSTAGRMVYVKFAFIWGASSDIFDFADGVSTKLLADALALPDWEAAYPPFTKLQGNLNLYSQCGVINGTINLEDIPEEQELYLFGHRLRYLGETISGNEVDISHITGYVQKNGSFVHLTKISVLNVVKNLMFGYVVQPDARIKAITHVDDCFSENAVSKNENRIKVSFTAERFYSFSGSVSGPSVQVSSLETKSSTSYELLSFHLNGNKGSGILQKRKMIKPLMKRELESISPIYQPAPHVVVSFTDESCQSPELTGGKGSSLGKLTQLSRDLQTFIVPRGIVLTTSAYKRFLTKTILEEIKNLKYVLNGKREGDVKEACKRVQDGIVAAKVPTSVQDALRNRLNETFGDAANHLKFAVRSSATGEDTEQMSAAGQMDTFLGVTGINEVLLAVKKCWASQFSFIAIHYKRRYGQKLNSPMAVVVQEMVACDVAGVLFTCDPLTGYTSVVSITANYGLGESVVSGSEEPDSIELHRDHNDQLRLKATTIGAKSRKIIVKDGGGPKVEDVPPEERNICCLSEEMALRLGRLAIKIEKYYRSQRDIEWGFWNNNIYIFQSRPVTSGAKETVFEIDHEFDGPLRIENDFFSVSNVGEVLPGATSPLGAEVFFRNFIIFVKRNSQVEWQSTVRAKYFHMHWLVMGSHVMFNVMDMFRNCKPGKADPVGQATMIAFFGRLLEDKDIFEAAYERYGESKKEMPLLTLYRLAKILVFSGKWLKKALKFYEGYRIPLEKYQSSKTLFEALLSACCDLCKTNSIHMLCSQSSTMWNMFIFTILGKAKGAFDEEVYQDFAHLMTSNGHVESADVPSAIQSLTFHISKDRNPEEFKKLIPEEALLWLQTTKTTSGKIFREFIEKHGHRGLKEFDMYSISWGTNPKSLVQILQRMAGTVSEDSAEKTENSSNRISELKVPLGFWSKLKLRFLIPISRRGVQHREASKSLLVKTMNAWRKGYWHLAKLMVSEGRIPEEDLLFFMTLEEIRELLETRSPKILARAAERYRRHPVLDKHIYPEIMKGQPRPINETETPIIPTDENFMMKGIPVSRGTAKAFVRVAVTLEEASLLKPGEILLTYSTDIGWSPYFPTLAGVATELGGLISHGAVVSREYGIPCIAGLHGATRMFQTGDYVSLDGNKGILQKLPPPAEKSP